MTDSLWYIHTDMHGGEPHCRRLSRSPMHIQWEAAIHLAVEVARGQACRLVLF